MYVSEGQRYGCINLGGISKLMKTEPWTWQVLSRKRTHDRHKDAPFTSPNRCPPAPPPSASAERTSSRDLTPFLDTSFLVSKGGVWSSAMLIQRWMRPWFKIPSPPLSGWPKLCWDSAKVQLLSHIFPFLPQALIHNESNLHTKLYHDNIWCSGPNL